MTPAELAALVQQVAATYVLNQNLLTGQVQAESAGNPWAFRFEPYFEMHYIQNNTGAKGYLYGPLSACSYGLLQIMLETAIEIGFEGRPEDLFDPSRGLNEGAKYLKSLLDWSGGDYPKALSAYNGGKGSAMKTPYPNLVYVQRVYHLAGVAMPT